MRPEELLSQGRPAEALEKLQEDVRNNPTNAKLRVFLFQLLCVLGEWDRAMTQLSLAAELDAENLLMAHVCRPILICEALRAEVWAGKRSPLVLGEPKDWVGWILQANQMAAQGHYKESQELRQCAFELSPAIPGTINDQPFEWIADADPRLGPIMEAIVNGSYYWIPFANVQQVSVEAPSDLRDIVWTPAQFTWSNGGTSPGFIPTRYPGSEQSEDGAILMARRTEWVERATPEGVGFHEGLGQRLFITDQAEYALLDLRSIRLTPPFPPTAGEAEAGERK